MTTLNTISAVISYFDHESDAWLETLIPEGHIIADIESVDADADEEQYLDRDERIVRVTHGTRDDVLSAWAVRGGATFTPAVAS
jgi:hypothetical protein